MNENSENSLFHREGKAICVGLALNIACIIVSSVALAVSVFFLSMSTKTAWSLPAIVLACYIISGIGMTFSGFVTSHIAKTQTYTICFYTGFFAAIMISAIIQFVMNLIEPSSEFNLLSEPIVLGFAIMQMPTMVLGGFLYKVYCNVSTESKTLDSELHDEYFE